MIEYRVMYRPFLSTGKGLTFARLHNKRKALRTAMMLHEQKVWIEVYQIKKVGRIKI